ncbi:M4 family metallopeptidase [Streptosporangium jomthongense]|uniref:M4 family metallopeptidase n=1 Tax=Streptosporangium jomthongense TaxID=1193683 RepID=A0ABV8EZL0_9ACTN
MNRIHRTGAIAMLAAAAMTAASTSSGALAAAPGAVPYGKAASAGTPVFAPSDPQSRLRAESAADVAIAAQAKRLHKGSGETLTLAENVTGAFGVQYLRYSRTYKGLPVYGGEVVVGTDRSGGVVQQVTTGQTADITVGTVAKVTGERAAAIARSQLATVESAGAPALVVHATTATPRLAWAVDVSGATTRGPSVLHVFVDARTGAVIDKVDEVREGTGNSYYNGNPVTISTSGSFGSYTMSDLTRPGLKCGNQSGQVYARASDSWGNGTGTDLVTACVDVMFAAQTQWNMLKNWLGRNGHDGLGHGFPGRVGLDDVNAFWNGSYTSFGHSSDNLRQVTSLDTVGHEYGHAIFQGTPGGAGSGVETDGLNESAGDIFGALTEAYANEPATLDPPDYLVGEEVNLVGTGPIRYMYNPSLAGDPNCYPLPSNIDPHKAAGPQNHWFYLLAEGSNPGGGKPSSPICSGGPVEVVGIGIQKAGLIFMGGLQGKTQPWTHRASRIATLRTAKTHFNCSYEFSATKAAWDAVGVHAQFLEPTCP